MTTKSASYGPAEPASSTPAARRRLELQSLVATLSSSFINLAPERLDAAMTETLGAVGEFAGADRALLATFEEDSRNWDIPSEWCRRGLRPLRDVVAALPAAPWVLAELRAGRSVRIGAAAKWREPEPRESALLAALDLRSVFVLPVFRDDRLLGAAAIGERHVERIDWPEDLTALLELSGRLMVDALSRRAAEQAHRNNELLWRSLCECPVLGVFVVDRQGAVRESNEAGLRIIGRSRSEVEEARLQWRAVTPPEYHELDLRGFRRLRRGAVVVPWEKEILRPDRSRVPVLATLASSAAGDSDVLALCIDLSEHDRTERELRRSNRFDQLLASLAQRLIALPASAIDRAVSHALAEVGEFFELDRIGLYETGENHDVEMLKLGWLADPGARIREEDTCIQLARLPWWRERLRAGRTVYLPTMAALPAEATAERAFLEAAGIESFLAVPLHAGRTGEGALHFAAAHPLDVSDQNLALLRVFGDIVANARERKRVEEELAAEAEALERRVHQRRAQLQANNEQIEAFGYSVSHDLRAPLRAIDGLSQILVEDFTSALDPRALELIGRTRQAVQRMNDLIDGLLQLSRVVRTHIEWAPVNLSALVAAAAEERRASAPDRTVEVEIADDVVVQGDQALLRIAVMQLIDNAWKFTAKRASARIRFGITKRQGRRTYFLGDDGVGFEAALAGRLFEAFQRLHGVDEFEGHGIGLATVARIVRMHGGTIWAEGERGRGATIFFTLGSRKAEDPR